MALVPGAVSKAATGRAVEEARGSVVGRGAGAGVIWPGEGLVLTNVHVISGGCRALWRGNIRDTLPELGGAPERAA